MTDEQCNILVSGLEKIALGLTAIRASGGYKTRKRIHLTDTELSEYMQRIETEIYSAFASNLILQEMFSDELKKDEIKKEYDTAVNILLERLVKSKVFRG